MKSREPKQTLTRPQKFAVGFAAVLLVADVTLSLRDHLGSENLAASRATLDIENLQIAASHVRDLTETSVMSLLSAAKSSPALSAPVLSGEEKELCQIKNQSAIPLGGKVRTQSVERVEGGRRFWIKSSLCPDELYSMIELDKDGRIEKEINCQSTSLTELTLNSGLQFAVSAVPSEESGAGKRPMALSGPGRFLVNCPDTGLTLTRDGRFDVETGLLINSEGCTAWTRKEGGRAVFFTDGETLNTDGCSESSRECLEVLDVDPADTYAFNFKTSKSLSVLDERGLRPAKNPYVFQNSLEDLDSPSRSLTGLEDWESRPVVIIPSKCP